VTWSATLRNAIPSLVLGATEVFDIVEHANQHRTPPIAGCSGVISGAIAGVLFGSMLLAIEIGLRVGFSAKNSATEASRSHVSAIQSSILGILALLLAFTFSLSLQRFDSRSEAVVNEANAIGTAYLRAQLLPASLRDDAQVALREYLELRVQASAVSGIERAEREELLTKTARSQTTLWGFARRAAEANPNPVTSGLFIQSLNEVFDAFGRRVAALDRHVPEMVLLLLYVTFVMAGAIVGFASGAGGHRPSMVSYIMIVLMVVLVFIILDLDRPRRGVIEVSQKSLYDLQAAIKGEAKALGTQPPANTSVPASTGQR
jgi:uncharacterized membrane protein (Fun14 family)